MVLRELLLKLGLNIKEAEFAKGELAAKVLEKAFDKVVESVGELAHKLVENVDEVAEYAEMLDGMAQQAGLSSEELQRLGRVAATEGVSMEDFSHGMILLSRTMQEAADGGEQASQAFSRLGVSFSKNGKLRSAGDVFADISEAFSKMPDGAKKTAGALELLGRSGAQMIPVLNKGREELEQIAGVGLGTIMNEEAIKAGKEIVVLKRQLAIQSKDLWREAIGPLLPAIHKLLKRFFDWKQANAALIKQSIQKWIGYVIKGIEALSGALSFLIRNAAAVKAIILTGLVVAFGQLELKAVAAGEAALRTWLKAAAPFVAIGAIIAGILLLYDDFQQYEKDQANHSKKQHSLYGSFLKQMDELYKDRPKPAFLQHFLEFLEALRNAGKYWGEFKDTIRQIKRDFDDLVDAALDGIRYVVAFAESFGATSIGGKVGKKLEAIAQANRDILEAKNRPAISRGNRNFRGFSDTNMSVAPGGSRYIYTPMAPAAPAMSGGVTVQSQTTIQVSQQPGQSTSDLADEIMSRQQESRDAEYEAAQQALRGDQP